MSFQLLAFFYFIDIFLKLLVKDGNLDATQEMFAMGFCNILGSFFGSMPTCGAFTRSAVSNASGVRTPMAGIYSGILLDFQKKRFFFNLCFSRKYGALCFRTFHKVFPIYSKVNIVGCFDFRSFIHGEITFYIPNP